MISREDGPLDVFVKIRIFMGVKYSDTGVPFSDSWIGRGIICVWCVSFWVSLALQVAQQKTCEYSQICLLSTSWLDFIITWLSIAALAVLIDKIIMWFD